MQTNSFTSPAIRRLRTPLAAVAFCLCSIAAVAQPTITLDAIKKARIEIGTPALGAMVASATGAPVILVDGIRELEKPELVSTDARWHVGSVAKSMTSTLVGRLVDQGKLRLDSPLSELLPSIAMREEYKKVTLLQVMQHRGGIIALMRPNPELNRLVNEIQGDGRAKAEAAARWILNQAPAAAPGTKMEYSNGGYALIGHIVERTMNENYRALMKRDVFAPLGMASAEFGWPIDFSANAPRGHGPGPNGIEPAPADYRLPQVLDPAGNVSASLADLARYLQAHLAALNGSDKFLKPATAKQLHQIGEVNEEGRGYASGWSIAKIPMVGTRHGHNGSAGTFYAEIAFIPEKNIVAAVVSNSAPRPDQRPPPQSKFLRELLIGSGV